MSDNDDVPFNRDFPLKPGVVQEVRPGVRRILCNNPSPFTFTGTVSYIVGKGKVAIIDPGPDNEAHAAALLEAVRGETVESLRLLAAFLKLAPDQRSEIIELVERLAISCLMDEQADA